MHFFVPNGKYLLLPSVFLLSLGNAVDYKNGRRYRFQSKARRIFLHAKAIRKNGKSSLGFEHYCQTFNDLFLISILTWHVQLGER
jgi:hypothetical protein